MDASGVRLPTEDDVVAARDNIRGRAIRTPLLKLNAEIPGCNIYIKLENLQPLGSFKIRPAVNALRTMKPERLQRGVLTASAGNFGQGLAFAAREIGVPITVIVPETSAAIKAAALANLGAMVIRVPFDEWWAALTRRSFPDVDGVFVHPVAESAVVAGNATIGAEILEDLPNVQAVVVPFGGGGLISGIGSVMRRLGHAVRMIAVESGRIAASSCGPSEWRADHGPSPSKFCRWNGEHDCAQRDVAARESERRRGCVRIIRSNY